MFGKRIAANLGKMEWWEQHPGAILMNQREQYGGGGGVVFNHGAGAMREAPGSNN